MNGSMGNSDNNHSDIVLPSSLGTTMKPRHTISREKCICVSQAMSTERLSFIYSRFTGMGENFVKLNNQEWDWLKKVFKEKSHDC